MPDSNRARPELVSAALRLVTISVAFGLLSGAVSVTTGLRDHSLGVYAVGLGAAAAPGDPDRGLGVLIDDRQDQAQRHGQNGKHKGTIHKPLRRYSSMRQRVRYEVS